jgi:hypothetical protein
LAAELQSKVCISLTHGLRCQLQLFGRHRTLLRLREALDQGTIGGCELRRLNSPCLNHFLFRESEALWIAWRPSDPCSRRLLAKLQAIEIHAGILIFRLFTQQLL